MKSFFYMFALVCIMSCGGNRDVAKSDDQENIQGTWLAQTESVNGVKKDVVYVYVFSQDKLTFRDENGKEVTYSYKLDITHNPKLIILQSGEALANSASVSVAYDLVGDSLRIVVAPEGLVPTEISDKNNQELIVCKRKGI
jgi:uncharacterized protein (TIGR03067 family)